MNDYFPTELGIPVHFQPITRTYNDKLFFIGHGDGLGPGDHGYKLLKAVMSNKFSQWLYRRIHPDTGIGLASWLSKLGPKHVEGKEEKFFGEDEWLIQFARTTLQQMPVNYFIFGHRHMALDYRLTNSCKYINLGDWIVFNSFAVFDGSDLTLNYYKEK
ncbi:MAG: hypothetical protein EBZ77_15765 [Chitinophagia bacterium]|nr:hypothetical protein [Chitinophagia bacterium]